MNEKILSIYIHVPFCKSKCNYCDFYSLAGNDNLIPEYFEALEKEIYLTTSLCSGLKENYLPVKSIFFGGGTPGYVPAEFISKTILVLKKFFTFDEHCEITLECNPGSLNKEKVLIYLESGVNRISLGLQSSNNEILKTIGRTHKYIDFFESVKMLQENGIGNINADIMFGLPGQTVNSLIDSIQKVIYLGIEHISLYSLTLENKTLLNELFLKSPDLFPDEDTERKMYHKSIELMKSHGFIHYEISNFAKSGKMCNHNIYCWKLNDYLGFGSAAHSFNNGVRYSNVSDIKKYINAISEKSIEMLRNENIILTKEDQEKEFFMLGLRLTEGIDIDDFTEKFNSSSETYLNILEKLISKDLIERQGNTFKMTKHGIDFANQIFLEFI